MYNNLVHHIMITSQQFDNALKTISDYKSQLEKGLIVSVPKPVLIDIQNKISKHTFFTLQHYFEDHLKQKLEWNDLNPKYRFYEIRTLQRVWKNGEKKTYGHDKYVLVNSEN